MESLENLSKKNGSKLIVHPFKPNRISVRLLNDTGGGQASSFLDFNLVNAFESFEKEFSIKLPDISQNEKLNEYIENSLRDGYGFGNYVFGTCFSFELIREKGYFACLKIQEDAMSKFKTNHSKLEASEFLILVSLSEANFSEAYKKMELLLPNSLSAMSKTRLSGLNK